MFELTREDWKRNREANINLVKENLIQIDMAKKIIALCDEKIAEFNNDKKIAPIGVR